MVLGTTVQLCISDNLLSEKLWLAFHACTRTRQTSSNRMCSCPNPTEATRYLAKPTGCFQILPKQRQRRPRNCRMIGSDAISTLEEYGGDNVRVEDATVLEP